MTAGASRRLDELPYAARVGDRRGVVRRAEGDEEGSWTWELDGATLAIDDPDEHLSHVPKGAVVTLEFGAFEVDLWHGTDGAVRYRGRADGVTGPARKNIEHALWSGTAASTSRSGLTTTATAAAARAKRLTTRRLLSASPG